MLSLTSWKNLSQATVITALGVILSAVAGSAPASAVDLRTVNFSGRFAAEALSGSQGVAVDLENGFFDGTYIVDADLLLSSPQVPLTNWLVNLRDSSNNTVKTFSSSLPGQTGQQVLDDGLYFTNFIAASTGQETSSFGLIFAPGFSQVLAGNPSDGLFSSVVFTNTVNGRTIVAGQIPIQPVPEPLSIAGLGVVGAMGLLMSRKRQNASQAA